MLARMTVAEYDPAKYPGRVFFAKYYPVKRIEPIAPINDRPAYRLTLWPKTISATDPGKDGDSMRVYATETILVEVTDVEVRPQGYQADVSSGGQAV